MMRLVYSVEWRSAGAVVAHLWPPLSDSIDLAPTVLPVTMSRRWYATLALALAALPLTTLECRGTAIPVKDGICSLMLGPSEKTPSSATTMSSAAPAEVTPRVARSGLRLRPRPRAELQDALSRLDVLIGGLHPSTTTQFSTPSTRPFTSPSPRSVGLKGVVRSIACSVKQRLKAMVTLKCARPDDEVSREDLN